MRKNWIYEVIITTSLNNCINSAPMGISTSDFRTIKMNVYKASKTYKNLIRTKKFTVNFADDASVFFKSLKTNRIKTTNSYLTCRVTKIKHLPEGAEIYGKIVDYNICGKTELINRANYLVIESLIRFTKIPFSKSLKSLKEDISENYRVIQKVAPRSKYDTIMKKIIGELK